MSTLLRSIIIALTFQGLMAYNSAAYGGVDPLIPGETTQVSAAFQTIQRTYQDTSETKFETRANSLHLGIKAPITENVGLGVSAGHLTHNRFDGPFEIDGNYGHQVQVSLDAGYQICHGFYAVGLFRYAQESWQFKKDILQDQQILINLDTRMVVAGLAVKYRIPRFAFYGRYERVLQEDNEGRARFTVLGSSFDYDLKKKTILSGGISVNVHKKVAVRVEENWIGDQSLTAAVDVSL